MISVLVFALSVLSYLLLYLYFYCTHFCLLVRYKFTTKDSIVCIPDNSSIHQAIEVTGSSSATEASAASDSVPSSSSHIPVPVQTEGSGRWCVPHSPHMSNNPREFG